MRALAPPEWLQLTPAMRRTRMPDSGAQRVALPQSCPDQAAATALRRRENASI